VTPTRFVTRMPRCLSLQAIARTWADHAGLRLRDVMRGKRLAAQACLLVHVFKVGICCYALL